jgi:thioredoxin 1
MKIVSMCRFEQAKKSFRTKFKKEYVMSKPIAVSDAEFEKKVLESNLPVIVDFWAPWCTPCKMIAPMLENIAQEYDGRLIVAKVNTDENPQWAIRYGVQGIPTLLFISGGKAIDHQVGVAPANVLKNKADALARTVPA